MSTVLVATPLGGVVGPNLTAPTGTLARAAGVPYLAGPFLPHPVQAQSRAQQTG
ncbi:hypothetical protein [Nocardia sp. CA-120079]|uniref:hypothetical protein n=1 Tax=Nocardia sp. CA-120079 TaxID=3239974 RepID=UPI003D977999